MHTARQLDMRHFDITVDGAVVTREEVLPGWNPWDQLGVIVDSAFAALGANNLIQLAITAFYDIRPTRRSGFPTRTTPYSDLAVYPEIYLFHVGGRYGLYSAFDFWPARKEVFVPADPRIVLDAVNDRAITRLLVPDATAQPVRHEYKEPAAARDRIVSAFAYSADGRVEGGDVVISTTAGSAQANARQVLSGVHQSGNLLSRSEHVEDIAADPDLVARHWTTHSARRGDEVAEHVAEARRIRAALDVAGRVSERYRRIDVDAALQGLTGRIAVSSVVPA